jgi:hypothetical protein
MDEISWDVGRVRFRTWLDLLPLELQQKIWREVNRATLAKLSEFRMYQGILRIYMRRAFKDEIKDVVFSRGDDVVVLRRDYHSGDYYESVVSGSVDHLAAISGLFRAPKSEAEHTRLRIRQSWQDGPRTVIDKFSSCGILDPKIVDSVSKAYGLCKPVIDDWSSIGRWDERAASRFTYPDGLVSKTA